ncbi:unnamed protein product [Psylliodes chrysocephalus]|uniref:Protein takeout-like n=1 Tax=Psylliodes chrysocephalus TaxID=3402493 RepID=A0A9P0G4A9_9CUCU|nr:unnamed protein product [Psylliodes chrysocephala]
MFVKFLLGFVVIINLTVEIAALTELPSHFPRCRRSDPKMEECLINATEYVRPYVREGIPDFLPPIKEFIVPEVTIDQKGSRAYNFKVHITNMSIFGMDQYKFKRYVFHPDKPMFSFIDVDLPQMSINGTYDLKGNLFFATLNGHGIIFANISDSNCKCNYTLEERLKNGVSYVHASKISAKMRIGNITDYGLTGLFKESKELEFLTNDIFKKNVNALVDEITPAIESVVTVFLDKIIAQGIEKIPYDKVYPK